MRVKKIFTALAAVGLSCGVSAATEQYYSASVFVDAQGTNEEGHSYSISAMQSCDSNDYYTGGFAFVWGTIGGEPVDETEWYDGACPDILFKVQGFKASHVMSINGITLSTECTEQIVTNDRGSTHVRFPNTYEPFWATFNGNAYNYKFDATGSSTADRYNGSCVVTATNASGVTDTYGDSASLSTYESRNRSNTKPQ